MSKPYLSVIVPCYEEAENLPRTFPIFEKFVHSQKYSVELVFVNDGSPDKTGEILKKLASGKDFVRIIDYKPNRGKGFAVRKGMLEASGEIRLFADTDNATPIEQVNKLLEKMDSAQVAIGSRYIEKGHLKVKQPFYRVIGSRFLNFFFRIMIGLRIKDTQCGFKLFSAKAAEAVFSRQTFARFSFDVEIIAIAHSLGYKVKEVGVDWYAQGKGTVHPLRDGLRFLRALRIVRWALWRGVYKEPSGKFLEV